MVYCQKGNLLELIDELKLDGLINAANGIGPMGRGIAGAIRKYGGDEIQIDAFSVCNKLNPQAGDAYSTIPGSLKVKRIIHAVTMKMPGGFTSYSICNKAFRSALNLAKKEGITKIGCTALGTGVGGLDSTKIAEVMFSCIDENDIDIVFVDFDEKFIEKIESLIGNNNEK